ncbi:MAG: hypothetical protein ACREBN_06545 [Burkholderiaceae bacterium]
MHGTTSIRFGIVAALICVVGIVGCKPSETPAKADKSAAAAKGGGEKIISRVTLTPDSTETLKAGTSVKIGLEVDYVVPREGGMVGAVVDGAGGDKPLASTVKDVPGGAGTTKLELDFKVPANAKLLRVQVPLYAKGETKSSEIVTKEYTVTP